MSVVMILMSVVLSSDERFDDSDEQCDDSDEIDVLSSDERSERLFCELRIIRLGIVHALHCLNPACNRSYEYSCKYHALAYLSVYHLVSHGLGSPDNLDAEARLSRSIPARSFAYSV